MPRKIITDDENSNDSEKKVIRRTRKKSLEESPASAVKKSSSDKIITTSTRKSRIKKNAEPEVKVDNKEKIFALDIGTRSVIGIVAVQEENGTLTIVATHREEHKTRAMLDGQIHDVPQVAAVIKSVKKE